MTLEERARGVLWTVLDGLQMTERQRDNAVTAMLVFAAEERERCAKAADNAADHEGPFTDYFRGRDQGCHDAAAAIRALI